MVFFTCQHCGDPVKKPAVEKHYNTKCRFKSYHLTCVDCLKDFSNEDYGKHNQCITEEQRYSAQGTVAKVQKGKNKQEKYIEMIQQIIATEHINLTPVQKRLLEACANSDNVPRKPRPFENFMRNVARCNNIKDIQSVFNIIEEFSKKASKPNGLQEKEKVSLQKNGATSDDDIGNNCDLINGNNETSKDGKINKKKKKPDNSSVLDVGHDNSSTENTFIEPLCNDKPNEESNIKQKKVKNKNKTKDSKLTHEENFEEKPLTLGHEVEDSLVSPAKTATDSKVDIHDDVKENNEKLSRKEIKKRKKYEKYLEQLENESNIVVEKSEGILEAEETHDSKKKKKKKYVVGENVSEVELKIHSKENKKRKLEDSGDVVPEKKTKEEHPDCEMRASTNAEFNWADTIKQVLHSRPDKEISLKKLGKKVISEYQTVKQDHRTYEELLAKFNKKVNKVKGVTVLRDRAKLIE